MIGLKINEIHVKFSDRNAGVICGALVFLKRPMSVLFSTCANLSKTLKNVNYLPEKSTGSETDVFPPKLFTFGLHLECLILQWLLITYFRKQHLSRGKGREGPHVNESFGKK